MSRRRSLRWTRRVRVGAEHAAVAVLRSEHLAAAGAPVDVPARVLGHRFAAARAAERARDRRVRHAENATRGSACENPPRAGSDLATVRIADSRGSTRTALHIATDWPGPPRPASKLTRRTTADWGRAAFKRRPGCADAYGWLEWLLTVSGPGCRGGGRLGRCRHGRCADSCCSRRLAGRSRLFISRARGCRLRRVRFGSSCRGGSV